MLSSFVEYSYIITSIKCFLEIGSDFLQWQAFFGYNLGLKFHTWNANLTSFRVEGAHGCIGGCHCASSVGPFRSICVMYVKCFSLVRYRPYIPSGTLLFNHRSLPAAGNYYYYYLVLYSNYSAISYPNYSKTS